MSRTLEEQANFVKASAHLCANRFGGNTINGEYHIENIKGTANDVAEQRRQFIGQANTYLAISSYKLDITSKEGKLFKKTLLKKLNDKKDSGQTFQLRLLINQRAGLVKALKPNKSVELDTFVQELQRNFPMHDIQLVYHQAAWRNSYHQKFWLADNSTTGNIHALICSGDIWNETDPRYNRHESSVEITGDLASSLQGEFKHLWRKTPNADQDSPEISMPRTKQGQIPGLLLISRPRNFYNRHATPYVAAIIAGLKRSQTGDSVSIITNNLNDPLLIAAIIDAIQRGVTIQFTCFKQMGGSMQHHYIGGGKNDETIDSIIQRLDPIFWPQCQFRWATCKQDRSQLVKTTSPADRVHSKSIVFSWGMSTLGSSPLDQQAHCSREIDTVFFDTNAARQTKQTVFDPVYNTSRDYFIDRAISLLPERFRDLKDQLAKINVVHAQPTDQPSWRQIAADACNTYNAPAHITEMLRAAEKPTIQQSNPSPSQSVKQQALTAIDAYLRATQSKWFRHAGQRRAKQLRTQLISSSDRSDEAAIRMVVSCLNQQSYKAYGFTHQVRYSETSLNTFIIQTVLQQPKLTRAMSCRQLALSSLADWKDNAIPSRIPPIP